MIDPKFTSDDIIVSKVTLALDIALQHAEETYVQSRKISKNEWFTSVLLKELYNSGKGLGFDVPYDVEKTNTNWLYDLIWNGKEKNDEPLLVVEFNLGSDFRDVRNDFEKLLMARSEIRLLITFGGDSEREGERALQNIAKLKSQMPHNNSPTPSEHFLFATIVPGVNSTYMFQYDFI